MPILRLCSVLVCPQSQTIKHEGLYTNVKCTLTFFRAAQFQDHQKDEGSSPPTKRGSSCSNRGHATEYFLKMWPSSTNSCTKPSWRYEKNDQ